MRVAEGTPVPQGSKFPFLFGGTFIEGNEEEAAATLRLHFPSFSEGLSLRDGIMQGVLYAPPHFPSFSEGLSLRGSTTNPSVHTRTISLPFRRDFH